MAEIHCHCPYRCSEKPNCDLPAVAAALEDAVGWLGREQRLPPSGRESFLISPYTLCRLEIVLQAVPAQLRKKLFQPLLLMLSTDEQGIVRINDDQIFHPYCGK